MPTGFAGRGRAQPNRGGEALRTFALFAGALLLLHHIRYALTRMSPSQEAAAAHAHSYLSFAVVLVMVLVGLAAAFFVRDLARARRFQGRPPAEKPPRLSLMWLQGSTLLLGSYVVQETIESVVAHERLSLAHILFAQQGWTTIVLAAAFGGLVALLRRGARAAIALVARTDWSPVHWHSAQISRPSSQCRTLPRLLLLGSIAGRAPPLSAFGL